MAEPVKIAIDGGAASGKSTIGKRVAQLLGFTFLDSGLVYRALTWEAIRHQLNLNLGRVLARPIDDGSLSMSLAIPEEMESTSIAIDGQDITSRLFTAEIDELAPIVSRHPEVRLAVNGLLRSIGSGDNIVMVGRDIGTVVMPEADIKVYITAPLGVRAARRQQERGVGTSLSQTKLREEVARLSQRDERDAPQSSMAPHALVIQNVGQSVEQIARLIVGQYETRFAVRAVPTEYS